MLPDRTLLLTSETLSLNLSVNVPIIEDGEASSNTSDNGEDEAELTAVDLLLPLIGRADEEVDEVVVGLCGEIFVALTEMSLVVGLVPIHFVSCEIHVSLVLVESALNSNFLMSLIDSDMELL